MWPGDGSGWFWRWWWWWVSCGDCGAGWKAPDLPPLQPLAGRKRQPSVCRGLACSNLGLSNGQKWTQILPVKGNYYFSTWAPVQPCALAGWQCSAAALPKLQPRSWKTRLWTLQPWRKLSQVFPKRNSSFPWDRESVIFHLTSTLWSALKHFLEYVKIESTSLWSFPLL